MSLQISNKFTEDKKSLLQITNTNNKELHTLLLGSNMRHGTKQQAKIGRHLQLPVHSVLELLEEGVTLLSWHEGREASIDKLWRPWNCGGVGQRATLWRLYANVQYKNVIKSVKWTKDIPIGTFEIRKGREQMREIYNTRFHRIKKKATNFYGGGGGGDVKLLIQK